MQRQIPNAITLLRIVLLIPVFICLIHEQYQSALFLFLLAGISDSLDGLLARRYHWKSRFGSIADPIADKLLIVFTLIGLTWVGAIPLWLTSVMILRDFVIVSGAIAYHYLLGDFEIVPSMISKINTGTQLGFLMLTLLDLTFFPMPRWFITFGIGCVFTSSVLSGVDYVWTWGRKAQFEWNNRER